MGAELYAETPVLSVVEDADGNALNTERGETRAKKVIFATNGYTGSVLPQYTPVITPYRGVNSHLVAMKKDQPFLESTYNLRYSPKDYDYMAPQPDGSIILGGATSRFRDDGPDADKSSWWNCVDDSVVPDGVEGYFPETLTKRLRQWKDSGAAVDYLWSGSRYSQKVYIF
jgi:glycine/D-amino acid oxidase-like deaminating enzyme